MDNETKDEKFKRIAEYRVNKVMKEMRKLSKLSNTNNYSYTEDQVSRILAALKKQLKDLQTAFENPQSEAPDRFRL